MDGQCTGTIHKRASRDLTPGLSASRSATCKAAEDDCLERRNSIRPCVPSHVAYKAERGGNELFWSPWKDVSTLASVVSRREPKMLRGSSCSEYRGFRFLCHG